MKPLRLLMIIALAGLVAGPHAVQASSKHFTTLNAPWAGTFKFGGTWVTGINQRGDIVGYYFNRQGTYGFLLHQGRYTTITFPGGQNTMPTGINRQGDIVGTYRNDFGLNGFLLHEGKYRTFRFPKAAADRAQTTGINARGDIVGWYRDGKHVVHGFLLHQSTYTVLDHPKAHRFPWSGTFANGINDTGDVVGYYDGSYYGLRVAFDGFLLQHGKYTTFDAPMTPGPREVNVGEPGTYALAINQAGDIVGWYPDRTMLTHGFLLHLGAYIVLDDPRAATAFGRTGYLQPGTRATGVNARGDVVGTYVDSKGVSHGFIWR